MCLAGIFLLNLKRTAYISFCYKWKLIINYSVKTICVFYSDFYYYNNASYISLDMINVMWWLHVPFVPSIDETKKSDGKRAACMWLEIINIKRLNRFETFYNLAHHKNYIALKISQKQLQKKTKQFYSSTIICSGEGPRLDIQQLPQTV